MNDKFYISPEGSNYWTGRYPEPLADNSDGPFGDFFGATEYLQKLAHTGQLDEAEVFIKGGTYRIDKAIHFSAKDSGKITYKPYPNEEVTFSGGREIAGFSEEKVNGKTVWKAHLPFVEGKMWGFNSLYVNGEFRPRSRYPKEGTFRIKSTPVGLKGALFESSSCFEVEEGELDKITDLTTAEAVIVHFWAEERMPIVDFKNNIVFCDRKSIFNLQDDFAPKYARYWLENVFEALSEEGEWYLDKEKGNLYYIPKAGETLENTKVEAPVIDKIMIVDGATNLTFSGINFTCTDWKHTENFPERLAHMYFDKQKFGGSPQAACFIGGAIDFRNSSYCKIENSHMTNLGYYAVDIGYGSNNIRIDNCEINECCAGGVRITGPDSYENDIPTTKYNAINNCKIYNNTHVFYSAVGVAVFDSFGNSICGNEIYNMEYSGVSCGWVWGFNESNSHHNIIENNHIHNLGTGLMCDMGGIYLLGEQQGTIVRGNIIHDIVKYNYGGWGIYLDEGSSYIVVENNKVYATASEAFYQHYGRENIVRNNEFSSSGSAVIRIFRILEGSAVTFISNKITAGEQYVYVINEGNRLSKSSAYFDNNEIEISSGRKSNFCKLEGGEEVYKDISKWQEYGFDKNSYIIEV